jgi:uncharacterized membrane protein YqhA
MNSAHAGRTYMLKIERFCALAARLLMLAAVIGSMVGAVLMVYISLESTVMAAWDLFMGDHDRMPAADATAFKLISTLDHFLLAIVLLYFSFGIYGLFIRPDRDLEEIGVPGWLRVSGIGELKQTLAEVIVVVLFVLFLRVALEAFVGYGSDLAWQEAVKILTLPISIFLLAAGLRLAELLPKRHAPPEDKMEK